MKAPRVVDTGHEVVIESRERELEVAAAAEIAPATKITATEVASTAKVAAGSRPGVVALTT